jgi:hypothetical protein
MPNPAESVTFPKSAVTFAEIRIEDLSHRRLPNVEVSAPFEVVRLNFKGRVHGVLRSLTVTAMPAST